MFRTFITLLLLTCPCLAMEWNGITPLKTTRAEVHQMLGTPAKDDQGAYFEFNGDRIEFSWTESECIANKSIEVTASNDVVSHVTVIPRDPKAASIMYGTSIASGDSGRGGSNKRELKDAFRKWLVNGLECLGTACSITNTSTGFGYTISDLGTTAIYYSANSADQAFWESTENICKERQTNDD